MIKKWAGRLAQALTLNCCEKCFLPSVSHCKLRWYLHYQRWPKAGCYNYCLRMRAFGNAKRYTHLSFFFMLLLQSDAAAATSKAEATAAMSLEVTAQREKMRAELEKAELTAERNTLLQGLVLSESERRKKVRLLLSGALVLRAGVSPCCLFRWPWWWRPCVQSTYVVSSGLLALFSCLFLG